MSSITLPDLPYSRKALSPHISEETLDYHYGKHHAGYVTKLNGLLEKENSFKKASLEELIKESAGALFNNAAQVWNHTFYWNSLSPANSKGPAQKTADILEKHFGSVEQFKEQFTAKALGQFGSGWAWLVQKADGALAVTSTSNAENPLQKGEKPLLTCDVWEHAYYIDYRNSRPGYLKAFWEILNWSFIEENLQK